MPKEYLGTAQEGNLLVQDEVEVENTLAIVSRLNLGSFLWAWLSFLGMQ